MNREPIGKRSYVTRLKPRSGWPELTALIDVLFLTLIFFALSSSFVRVSGISVELPQLQTSGTANLERFVVTIGIPTPGNPGQLYFNDQLTSPEALKQRFGEIRDRSVQASIIIRADRRVSFEQVSKIMALAQAANLASFIAVTKPQNSEVTSFGQ